MISEILRLFRAGWRISDINPITACWILEREGLYCGVPIPDYWTLPE